MNRYERQERFGPVGAEGQARIGRGGAVVVGCGALGSAAAEMLARAGVGRLRLVDRDVVEEGNLHRQSLFDEEDVRQGLPKAVAAARHLAAIRSDLEPEARVADLDGETALELLRGGDVILDGTDNFEARHVLNEACLELGRPWIHGACLGATAVAWPILPGRACYACAVPAIPAAGEAATCDTAGILPPAVHAAASLQVAEALKLLAGRSDDVGDAAWSLDLWAGTSARVRVPRDPDCVACARRQWRLLGRPRDSEAVACGRRAVQVRLPGACALDLEALAGRLSPLAPVSQNRFLLRFAPPGEPEEMTIFRDGRVLVSGTREPARARVLVARWLGG